MTPSALPPDRRATLVGKRFSNRVITRRTVQVRSAVAHVTNNLTTAVLFAAALAAAFATQANATQANARPTGKARATSCTICHSNTDVFAEDDLRFAKAHAASAHAAAGVSCHDCHGGNPDPSLAEDLDAMDEGYAEHPFVGKPAPAEIAPLCESCHTTDSAAPGPPADPVHGWQTSVHARALHDKGDQSAPTCAVCHDAHAARVIKPADEVALCGGCHGREAELVTASKKFPLLIEHAGYLEEAGAEGCLACHEEAEPMTQGPTPSLGVCTSCHRAHGIVAPGPMILSPRPESPCAFCHEPVGQEDAVISDHSAPAYAGTRAGLLEQAPDLEPDALWDWLINRALELPPHRVELEGGGSDLVPEFRKLFEAFALQTVHLPTTSSDHGEEGGQDLAQTTCGRCHAAESMLGNNRGATASQQLLDKLRALTTRSAQAERLVQKARRGGVPSAAAQHAIGDAVDAQIRLATLVHTFDPEHPEFVATQAEASQHVELAMTRANDALAELSFRRRGLLVSLAFIVLVAISLALIIRRIDERGNTTP